MRGLYVHVPFCAIKCFYCDFTAFAGQGGSVKRYLNALRLEAARHARARAASDPRRFVHTLYIGGGTPSELSSAELEELFGVVSEYFGPLEGFSESTFEANPESLTPDRLEVLARAGIGRLSLGLQTMEPRLLKIVGRRHGPEDFLRVFRQARERGFSLNVDLMYALPTQTLPEALSSLDAVLGLEPDHISLYGLQVEDRTLFGKREVEVDEDLAREMFEASLDRLRGAGFTHYEISNFARPGRESAHNMIYWRNGEYVGLGCGASGHLDGIRYCNLDRLADYCRALEEGKSPVAESESLRGRERLGETLLLGLRVLSGVELTPESEAAFGEAIERLSAQGLIEVAGAGRGISARHRGQGGTTSSRDAGPAIARPRAMCLTRSGVFLANRVFEEFVPPFRAARPEIAA
ncbi:MAG: radical SAM family heme chaperone HemW [Elusimicrobia bacterium]|nr:radical SAM family heme chaperone HemW [Elusimicrobiota bacterium]